MHGLTRSLLLMLLDCVRVRSKKYASKHQYIISANRELVALGVSSLIGSVFGAYSAFGSIPRTKGDSHGRTIFFSSLSSLPLLTFFRLAILESHDSRTDTGDRSRTQRHVHAGFIPLLLFRSLGFLFSHIVIVLL
jgi:hypothetical protein